jgi:NAD(P) transhydrogenase subunit alpha
MTRPGDTVEHEGVTVIGSTDLAGSVAVDASQMYARNLAAFITRISDDDGNLVCDFDDEIVAETCITHDGSVTHPVARRALGLEGQT